MSYPKIPREILPRDDAFHGSTKRIAAEWWYFDAIFKNNYSVHVGLKTFTIKNFGLISSMIEVYREGILEIESKKWYLSRYFYMARDKPFISLFDKPLISFDNSKGDWIYNIDFQLPLCKANLKFKGLTKGWVIETPAESWAVALPKARVEGSLEIKGEFIPVKGTGYHDHNWNYTILTVMNYGIGWLWGKITSPNYTLVWAQIEKSNGKHERYAVVNVDGGRFYSISSDRITIGYDRFIRNHLRKAPTRFMLRIQDKIDDTPIDVDVIMYVSTMHYNAVFTAPYWRYHINAKGYITVGSKKETVNKTQIMELLKFS